MEVKLSFHRHHTSLCLLCIYRNVFDGKSSNNRDISRKLEYNDEIGE